MDEGTLKAYRENEESINRRSISNKEKRYLRKYAKKIHWDCCPIKDKRKWLFHIGYIGNRLCKVAVCCDCDKIQVICGRFGRYLLKKYKRRVITRVNVLATLKTDDIFLYGEV